MTREGDVVSSYRLVRKIGEGGMGAVYEAAHTRIKNKHGLTSSSRGNTEN